MTLFGIQVDFFGLVYWGPEMKKGPGPILNTNYLVSKFSWVHPLGSPKMRLGLTSFGPENK